MVGVQLVLLRHDLSSFCSTSTASARRQVGAVGDAEDMRVHRDGRLAERDVQHHIGGLAADAGQRFQRLALAGTWPPCSASRIDSATTFFALPR